MPSIHPEQSEDEIFISNEYISGSTMIGWKSIRRGRIAYDWLTGEPVNDMVPIFIKRSEVEQANTESPRPALRRMLHAGRLVD